MSSPSFLCSCTFSFQLKVRAHDPSNARSIVSACSERGGFITDTTLAKRLLVTASFTKSGYRRCSDRLLMTSPRQNTERNMPSSVAEEHVPSQIELAWTPAGIKLLSLFGLDRIRGDPSIHSPSILPQILIAKPGEIAARSRGSAAATEFSMAFQ
jgi:hypothetical protein